MEAAITKMNELGAKRIPFLFVIDFKFQKPIVLKLEETDQENIFYKINSFTNFPETTPPTPKRQIEIQKNPISIEDYKTAFDLVQKHIKRGDSFLVNLTKPTPIETSLTLQEIFEFSNAKYKLYFKDEFVAFSPEIFVKITNNVISSHPMKGTISNEIPNAEKKILENKKELAEHTTIVDLIRNDMSMIAEKVWVEKFRYIDKITTQNSDLLQVSSKICGKMPENWQCQIGEILHKILPAGSICGAPKQETLKIIEAAENYNRGYYTGIFGIFDGENLDSGVTIRYIENTTKGLVFKSGGGITAQSNLVDEYNEMIDKIYIPL